GVVEAVGEGVRSVGPGDRVAGSWRVHCGVCVHCRRGRTQYCRDLRQERVAGGFAEFARVPESNVWPIPAGLSLRTATFCEPLACCYHGSRVLQIEPGEDVVVVGAGPIGLLHVQLARAQGARVIAVDRIASRLELAQRLGAQAVVNFEETSPPEAIGRLTDGKMADAVIVAASSLAAVEAGLPLLAMGGRMNIFAGIYPPGTLTLDPNEIHYRQIVLTGTHDYNPGHFTAACKLLADGTVQTDPLISHHLPLTALEEGLEIVAAQAGHKVMIQIDPDVGS
ncbi:MAG TPA: zinc-binding dehydrogenase, partial [Limnochordia bacterium]